MNETDQVLHQAIHQHMMSISPENIFSARVSLFNYLEKKINLSVSGTGLDIGSGSGYASIWLAKNKPINKIYAQEASASAVEQLLPRNIEYHKVSHIVEPLAGSFDNIPFKNELDFTISFGALHHSICLLSTMKSISCALKEGAYLIAQEPVMPNTTSNQDYINKYNIVEMPFGLKVRNGDRNDNFFREAEYIAAAAFSGMDLVFYEDFVPISTYADKFSRLFRVAKRVMCKFLKKDTPSTSLNKQPLPQGDLSYRKSVMRKVFVFKKHTTDYIPHVWKGLDVESRT